MRNATRMHMRTARMQCVLQETIYVKSTRMKRDQGKEEVKECCENYPNFNEDAKNWFYSKIGRNKMMHMQQKYQTFLKSYEDRKKNVTEKYNIKKYLSFLTNFLILFFVTFDFFYNIMKIIFKKVFSFYHNPLHSIQNTKHFLKKNVIYFTKTVNKYKELLLKSTVTFSGPTKFSKFLRKLSGWWIVDSG
ncbi:conserved Plasmodium protein, unknown function [Plasmodium ovale curtisi]|uniref:Uncharacterized protein n=1 Tax=Plasmodium ovale curtisi TaxID=864141 RepID=A0A1A8W117_PLAOA|nr:conserved Plasmodium protein, unknown function [Plasmodium ovale curtisi]SBS84845.1 conserved Plasmodium protein, unknown function [Plasmodium ovale curtisi]